jgi:hypothetical protein
VLLAADARIPAREHRRSGLRVTGRKSLVNASSQSQGGEAGRAFDANCFFTLQWRSNSQSKVTLELFLYPTEMRLSACAMLR